MEGANFVREILSMGNLRCSTPGLLHSLSVLSSLNR